MQIVEHMIRNELQHQQKHVLQVQRISSLDERLQRATDPRAAYEQINAQWEGTEMTDGAKKKLQKFY